MTQKLRPARDIDLVHLLPVMYQDGGCGESCLGAGSPPDRGGAESSGASLGGLR